MIHLIFFLLVGIGLFASLYFLARRSGRAEGGATALVGARQALQSLQLGLLPPEFVSRIFAKEDFDFVASAAPASVQELFLCQRTSIALLWVKQVRGQIVSLRQFHLGRSRFYARLSLRTEIALAMDFAALLIACRGLQLILRLRGPYAAPRVVAATASLAARVCDISEKSLAFLTPIGADMTGRGSAGGPAAA